MEDFEEKLSKINGKILILFNLDINVGDKTKMLLMGAYFDQYDCKRYKKNECTHSSNDYLFLIDNCNIMYKYEYKGPNDKLITYKEANQNINMMQNVKLILGNGEYFVTHNVYGGRYDLQIEMAKLPCEITFFQQKNIGGKKQFDYSIFRVHPSLQQNLGDPIFHIRNIEIYSF